MDELLLLTFSALSTSKLIPVSMVQFQQKYFNFQLNSSTRILLQQKGSIDKTILFYVN